MAFTGRAIYDTGIFTGVAEDVADIIGMISPYETPLLDVLGDSPYPARNVMHEWLEEQLQPNTIINSEATKVGTTETTTMQIADTASNGVGAYLRVGGIYKVKISGEFIQLLSMVNNVGQWARGVCGTSVASIPANTEIFLVTEPSLEGADVDAEHGRPRERKENYCGIIKKDVIISGTTEAVTHLGNVGSEHDHQVEMRTREALRELEKAAINGKLTVTTSYLGTSLSSPHGGRTFKGMWDFITTNTNSWGTTTITGSLLNYVIQQAWDYGAQDLDLIVCDANFRRDIDALNDSRVQVGNLESLYRDRVTYFEGSFGTQRVVTSRWMPASSLMVLSTQRIKVLPLTGRSFHYEGVAKTGDATKGMVIGEYTVEFKNENGMAKLG
jgi:hypothetical protein